jgi:hypothetical protein
VVGVPAWARETLERGLETAEILTFLTFGLTFRLFGLNGRWGFSVRLRAHAEFDS